MLAEVGLEQGSVITHPVCTPNPVGGHLGRFRPAEGGKHRVNGAERDTFGGGEETPWIRGCGS